MSAHQIAPHARRHLQDRLVHVPPHPRGHEGRRGAAWRRRQSRRSRRSLRRRQARTALSASPRPRRRSSPLSSATVAPVRSMSPTSTARLSALRWCTNVDRASTLMTDDARIYRASAASSLRTATCSTLAANSQGRRPLEHRRKLLLHPQARRDRHLPPLERGPHCTATLPSSISAIRTKDMTDSERADKALKASSASASPIGGLISSRPDNSLGRRSLFGEAPANAGLASL